MADAKKRTAASGKAAGAKRRVQKDLPLTAEKLGKVRGGAIVSVGASKTPTSRSTLT